MTALSTRSLGVRVLLALVMSWMSGVSLHGVCADHYDGHTDSNYHCIDDNSLECNQDYQSCVESPSSCTYLDVYGVTGTIPTELGLLTELTYLELDGEHFRGLHGVTGTIPTELGLLTELTYLWLNGDYYSNDLGGTVPTELGLLTELTYLDVSYNTLSGTVPTELRLLTEMHELSLSSNSLSGTLPTELGLLTELTCLDLYGNDLSGSLPTELGRMTAMRNLDVNSVSGLCGDLVSVGYVGTSYNTSGTKLGFACPTSEPTGRAHA